MYIMLKIIEITKNDVPSNAKHLPTIESVRRVDHNLTYNEFFHKFLINNEPCIIDTAITESWPCRQQWVLKDAPNFEFLGRLFGERWMLQRNRNYMYFFSYFVFFKLFFIILQVNV